jgi:internalin A
MFDKLFGKKKQTQEDKGKDKAAFWQQYARCANYKVLEKIWGAYIRKDTSLNLGGEQSLKDLKPLQNLTNLQWLFIDSTQISDLNPLQNLANLEWLKIENTKVNDLKPLQNLANLQMLYACNTAISDLKPLQNLANLQTLFINDTQVSNLSPLKSLIEKGIKVKWKSEYNGKSIYIENTPLSNPPIEIAKQGNAAILRYWAEQERSGTIQLNEARLLIVGQGGAGKTTLRKKLMDKAAAMPEAKDTTRGIEIDILSFPQTALTRQNTEGGDFGLHIWDFGGQDIQHYAHQFFLSDAAVYVLVYSSRKHGEEKGDDSNYWLSIIELLGKSSPTIILRNLEEGHTSALKNEASIRERFGNVRNFMSVDLSKAGDTDYKAFQDLEAEIRHLACGLPHIGKTYLRSFNDVREALKDLATTKTHIDWDSFEALCRKTGMTDTDTMRDYAHYFHQLGIALWFEDDLHLANYIFLRPKWIIDALFELLYDGDNLRQQAIISEKDTLTIWKKTDYRGMHGNLLRLMKNFEMCYELVGDTPQYIIPQLLPTDRATYSPPTHPTKVVFQYTFLPKGFLTRLTCRLHRRIDVKDGQQQVWSDAVQFTDANGTTVFAKETYAQNAIELIADGHGKRPLLNDVINTLKDINGSSKFQNLQVEILVPCPCETCKKRDKPYQFEFDYLNRKLMKGQIKAECKYLLDDVLIKDILKEVSPFSFDQIRHLIGKGQTQEAINLLTVRYDKHHEVILLAADMSRLEREGISGLRTRGEDNRAYQDVSERLLRLLRDLEGNG